MDYIGIWEDYQVYIANTAQEAKAARDDKIYLASGENRNFYRMYLMGAGVGWCDKETHRVVDFEIPNSIKLAVSLYRGKKKEVVPDDFVKEVRVETPAPIKEEVKATSNSSDFWSNIEQSIRETLASVGGE